MLLSFFGLFAFFFLSTIPQAAGVLNTFIIDQTSPSVHFSDGWGVRASWGSVGGSFESTTNIGASVTIELPTGTENVNYFGFQSSNGALYAACIDYGDPEGRVQIVDAFEHGGDVSQAASSLFAFTGLDSSKPHVLTVINLPDSRANNESTLTFDSLIVTVVDGTAGMTVPPPLVNVPQSSDDSPVNPGNPTGPSIPPSAASPGLSPGTNASPDISSSPRPVNPPTATEAIVAGPPPSAPSNTPSPTSPSPNLSPLGVGPQAVSQSQVPPASSAQLPGPTASNSAGAQPGPVPAASSPIPSQAAGSGNGTPAPSPTASANGAGSPGVSVSGPSGPDASPISGTAGSTPTSGAGSQSSTSNSPAGSSNIPSPSNSGSGLGSGVSSPAATTTSTDSNPKSGPSGTGSSSTDPSSSSSTTPGSSANNGSSKSRLSGPTIAVISILSALGFLSLLLGGIVLFAIRRKRLAGTQRAPSPETGEAGFGNRALGRTATMRSSWSSPHRSSRGTAELTNSFPVPPAHLGHLEHPNRDPVHLDPAQDYAAYDEVDLGRSERYAESSSRRTFSVGSSYETGSFDSSISDGSFVRESIHQPWLNRRVNEPFDTHASVYDRGA